MNMCNRYSGYYAVFVFSLAVIISGCTLDGRLVPEKGEPEHLAVETARVKMEAARYTLVLPGEIAPYETVKLYAKVSGFVKQIFVDRGSFVRRGQLLARLEAPEMTERYAAAAAREREVLERLRYSHQSYQRYLSASRSEGAVAPIELEQARARLMSDSALYQSLSAEMSAARQLTAYLEIRAPFSGVVVERSVSPGALVGVNEKPVITLAQQDRLRLTIAIPDKHLDALSESTRIRFTVGGRPGDTLSASFSRSSGVLDRKLRSVIAEFDIDNRDGKLKGGEYIRAEVIFNRVAPSAWVPSTSIVDTRTGTFVLKVHNDTLRRISVQPGIHRDGYTEVSGSLNGGDVIVAKGSEELRDGMRVSGIGETSGSVQR